MDVYTTEEQQVEAIKKWWHENKWSLIGGVAIGIAVIFGVRAWLANQHSYAETASTVYQVMMQQIAQGQYEEAGDKGKQLLDGFSGTPYAELAALAMARIKLEEDDLVAAEAHLRWVLDNADQEPVKHEARLRLARVLISAGKESAAEAVLEGVEYGSYASAYQSVLGDVYVSTGRLDQARDAYRRALSDATAGSASREQLQMKLDNLGNTQ